MAIDRKQDFVEVLENEVYLSIRTGVPEGNRKKFIYQQVARDAFLSHFSSGDHLTTDGKRICDAVCAGGFAAARELGWPVKKAARHLAFGLLQGIARSGGHFFSGACTLVRSAILCSLLEGYDFNAVAEGVLGAVIEAGREKDCNMEALVGSVSRAAVETANSFPSHNIAPMENLLMELLSGRLRLEGESWRRH